MTGTGYAKPCSILAFVCALLLCAAILLLLPLVLYLDVLLFLYVFSGESGNPPLAASLVLVLCNIVYFAGLSSAVLATAEALSLWRSRGGSSTPRAPRPIVRWGLWVLIGGAAALAIFAIFRGPSPARGYMVAEFLGTLALLAALTKALLSCARRRDA
ncbi:MAG: hypothetical protein LCH92_14120 [Proteobacteria bacterium]|nr:hypothetical protein [Pseudomonadota bacterium]